MVPAVSLAIAGTSGEDITIMKLFQENEIGEGDDQHRRRTGQTTWLH